MLVNENRKVKTILKFIGTDNMESVEQHINNTLSDHCVEFFTEEQLEEYFSEYLNNFYKNTSISDVEIVRYYTGIAFKEINAVLRDNWNYDYNGMITNEKKKEYAELASRLEQIISSSEPIPTNIKTYRGVSLASFKDYGITSLEELLNLKGQYYYDSAFTSTSLIRDKSFFNRELEWHENCNIEIEYVIPSDSTDAIPLITDDLSYSKVQTEYLLNKGNFSKIVDVVINEKEKKAFLKLVLVPKKIWDNTLTEEISIKK